MINYSSECIQEALGWLLRPVSILTKVFLPSIYKQAFLIPFRALYAIWAKELLQQLPKECLKLKNTDIYKYTTIYSCTNQIQPQYIVYIIPFTIDKGFIIPFQQPFSWYSILLLWIFAEIVSKYETKRCYGGTLALALYDIPFQNFVPFLRPLLKTHFKRLPKTLLSPILFHLTFLTLSTTRTSKSINFIMFISSHSKISSLSSFLTFFLHFLYIFFFSHLEGFS